MNTTLLIFIIITLHFIGDWVLQDRFVAKNKKKRLGILITHMLEVWGYLLVCNFIMYCIYNIEWWPTMEWAISNLILHFFIDMLLPAGKNERQMINYTALDQILHIGCLLLTLEYLIL